MSAKYEDKFIVINRKHLRGKKAADIDYFNNAIRIMNLPDNKYYVCNQDESYADEVIKTILNGESNK